MCQISVIRATVGGETEKIMDNVTLLEADPGGVTVSTLFDPELRVEGVKVKKIDFMGGIVTLAPVEK